MKSYSLSEDENQRLAVLLEEVKHNTELFMGYPVSKDFDYTSLMPFLKYPMNNLGDPFVPSTYAVGSRVLEKEVVEFFAELFRAEKDNWWGYVTNGGSEGNLYGLYLARELHPKGMVYYSEATHYSVQKNLHLLNMENITISTQANGEMDYEDLENTIRMNRQLPVIIMANIDGALSGSYSAFLEPRPAFDFADGADSIAISGHKFMGTPMPCGVVVVKKSNRDRIARSVAYIGSMDTTISGSRNGHSPLFLWYTIKKLGMEGLKQRALHCLDTARYAEEKLNAMGIPAWRNPNSITVNFPEPAT
eukprot:gene21575-25613_t